MQETYKIQELEQIRLLSDPFKLQLIQSFAEAAKTTKQVAEELGESVTKLYRHVDALHAAGLLEVVQEKQKRGTVERTFRAIAQRFEADYSLFNEDAGHEGEAAGREMLQVAQEELLEVLATGHDDDDDKAIILRVRGKATPEKFAELRQSLQDWLDSIPAGEESTEDELVDFGGLIAFYQMDSKNKGR